MFSPKNQLNQQSQVIELYLLPSEFEAKANKVACTPTGAISIENSATGITNTSKAVATEVGLYDKEGKPVNYVVADVALTKSVVNGNTNLFGGVKFRLLKEDGSPAGFLAIPVSNDNISKVNEAFSVVTTASNPDYLLQIIKVTHIPKSVYNETPEAINFAFPAVICGVFPFSSCEAVN